jgi:large subunit ribosomal protein L37Ae
MAVEKGLGPAKRFGPRYGRTVKFKLAKIEKQQRKPQICPYCDMPKAKRISAGIYECKKCNSKFTGRAYFLKKKAPVIIQPEEAEEKKEEAEA